MKPARFDYECPASLADAVALLDQPDRFVKVLAGAQTLGPMLNLRLVQPELLVDITRIPELHRVEEDAHSVILGACVTHAAIEDGRVPDGTGGLMPMVACGIAYRAVRTRGTIGGSLAHADPAADWLVALAALDAEVIVFGARGRRSIAVASLATGAFQTLLAPAEILEAVRVPKLPASARCGYFKACRKAGEFAHAMSAVLYDPDRGLCRIAVGATDSAPIMLADVWALFDGAADAPLARRFDRAAAAAMLREHGLTGDPLRLQMHVVALERALRQVQ